MKNTIEMAKAHRQLLAALCGVLIGISFIQCKTERKDPLMPKWQLSLEQVLDSISSKNALPGFSVGLVTDKGVDFTKGYGFANVADSIPFTEQTIMNVASISKTVVAMAVMKLIAADKISLDTPINTLLPFEVTHPKFPSVPITIEHLVTHTSGLQDLDANYDLVFRTFQKKEGFDENDYPEDYRAYLNAWYQNPERSLASYMSFVFSDKTSIPYAASFSENEPGNLYQYSNLGATLMGYIVEVVAAEDLKVFTKKEIFDPLGMKDTNWEAVIGKNKKIATKYVSSQWVEMPHFKDASYPDGGLHTSVVDLSKYLSEMIKGYAGTGTLLSSELYKVMMSSRLSEAQLRANENKNTLNSGVFWHLGPEGQIWHNGGEVSGAVTYMWFDPTTATGRILMTNYFVDDKTSGRAFIGAWNELSKTAKELQTANSR